MGTVCSGDRVQVIAGEFRGKTGRVISFNRGDFYNGSQGWKVEVGGRAVTLYEHMFIVL